MVVIGAIFTCLRSVENCAFRLFFGSANQGASARSSDHFVAVERQRSEFSESAAFLPLVFRSDSFCCVFADWNIVLFGNGAYFV